MSANNGRKTAGRRFLDAVAADYSDPDIFQGVVLDQIAALLDRIEQMEQRVASDGETVSGSRGQPVAHPLLGEIRLSRVAVQRIIDTLGEESQATKAARHAAKVRWSRSS